MPLTEVRYKWANVMEIKPRMDYHISATTLQFAHTFKAPGF